MENKSFWRWYLKGAITSLRYIFTFRWVKEPVVEAVGGSALFGTGGIVLGIGSHPLWLLLVLLAPIPFAHSFWRMERAEKESVNETSA